MADANPNAVAEGGEQAQEMPGMWQMIRTLAGRMMMIYFVTSLIKGFTGGPNQSQNATITPSVKYPPARNLFPPGQLFDLYMYLDESDETFIEFEKGNLFWMEKGLKYGDYSSGPDKDGTLVFQRTIPTPEVLLRNESLFLHVFITKSGQSPDPKDRNYIRREVVYEVKQLNKFKKKYYKKTSNLLTGKSEQSDEDLAKAQTMKYEVLNFWHPNISIHLIDDQTAWTKGALPSPLDVAVKFDPVGGVYRPIFMFNTYWNLGSEYMPINDTVKTIDLRVTYYPISLFKFQFYASQQMKTQWSQMLMQDQEDDDQDSIKQALLETNPILLGITMVVSLLHTVFEFLAFKNDIQFWRSRKDLVGLSVRSVLFSIFQSLVVFLYICDNDTNFMVKISVGVGLLIECWKIPKVMDVSVDWNEKILGVFPKIKAQDKGSYVESDTKVYDEMAFKYFSWVMFPLLIGYSIYSLLYVEQRGWYSWVLNMLYGYLLTFGFISMTPQLFINYKLKSVAHLPWRMLTYKFINTFIDDLFAFVIRMPLMYRIGCFRDDIIFVIYLYQRWIYRIDPTRVNEYGTSMVPPPEELEGEQKAIEDNKDEKPEENKKPKSDKKKPETKKDK
ncbi:hypothetical protein WR25_12697 isoform A [Diploscapter pachys]|uniref:Cleft lip and palate transmembrane protein 1 n=1 Tax=Diploscapter pachys TaxID=2018661 RepID=A0A2A2LLD8_9BILA|nr:hypothetical protein WR25_12697 isoform A [Diploscapter pachys]